MASIGIFLYKASYFFSFTLGQTSFAVPGLHWQSEAFLRIFTAGCQRFVFFRFCRSRPPLAPRDIIPSIIAIPMRSVDSPLSPKLHSLNASDDEALGDALLRAQQQRTDSWTVVSNLDRFFQKVCACVLAVSSICATSHAKIGLESLYIQSCYLSPHPLFHLLISIVSFPLSARRPSDIFLLHRARIRMPGCESRDQLAVRFPCRSSHPPRDTFNLSILHSCRISPIF